MNSGVSKSGSPAPNPQTSSPAALSSLAFASTANVGEGAMLLAQVDSFACCDMCIKKRSRAAQNVRQKSAESKTSASAKASLA